ncbi:MAG: adenylate/guanylate cyclase domain-containing protein [Flammeovirgaceae bacterium]
MITIRHKFLRIVTRQIIVWIFAFALLTFLREFGQELVDRQGIYSFEVLDNVFFQVLVGTISGVLFASYEYLFEKLVSKKMSFGKTILIAAVGYMLTIFLLIALGFQAYAFAFSVDPNTLLFWDYFSSGEALVVIIYCFLIGWLIEFFKEVDKKFGPGNLLKIMLGEFYEPKETERIFMFLDMRASTTIAEKLGHIKYSQLVQDCFKDIDAVIPYRAEVYQYVGDEVVLTWEKEKGLANANCLMAYFAFKDRLEAKKSYYLTKYGLLPEFKAGANLGRVTVAEVGEIKREIAYHGDTLNTAARIQNKCNEYQQNLLVSEVLVNALPQHHAFTLSEIGQVLLKGKNQAVNILAVQL